MKNLLMGLAFFLIILLLGGLCLITIDSKNIREQELRESLNMSIEDALSDCMINKSYTIATKDDLIADFCNKLMLQVNQNCDLKVKLISSDIENGIIYIQIISSFKHVNGEDEEITCTKAVVLEDKKI